MPPYREHATVVIRPQPNMGATPMGIWIRTVST